jgi:peptidoglycan hydrolase CwlO-like protein
MSKEIDKIFAILNRYERYLQNMDKILKKTTDNVKNIEKKVDQINKFVNDIMQINEPENIDDFNDTWVPENEIWNENYIDEENNDS